MGMPAANSEVYFTGLRAEEVPYYAAELLALARKPLERTGTIRYITPEQVIKKCIDREWQCWIAHDGRQIEAAFFTYIAVHETGYKSFTIDLVGGKNMTHWLKEAWGTFKAYAKANGCDEIIGAGRRGWKRVIGRMEGIDDMTRWRVEI